MTVTSFLKNAKISLLVLLDRQSCSFLGSGLDSCYWKGTSEFGLYLWRSQHGCSLACFIIWIYLCYVFKRVYIGNKTVGIWRHSLLINGMIGLIFPAWDTHYQYAQNYIVLTGQENDLFKKRCYHFDIQRTMHHDIFL